jgi:lysophospholipase L1-like esterase
MMHAHLRPTSHGVLTLALGLLTLAALGGALPARAERVIQDGQTIAFLGDSITEAGWGNPGGYVRLVLAGFEANGVKVKAVPAGVSGHKSNQMLERLQRDVLDKKPDWMTLSCGVNDVWHGVRGVPLPRYRTNIAAMVERCQAAGVKVMILSATVIGEDTDNEQNRLLGAYNDFLHALAGEKKCLLADLCSLFQEAIRTNGKPGHVLTTDGVHMNSAGDQLMAQGILRAFGLSEAELKKAQAAWLEIPGGAILGASYTAGKGKTLTGAHSISLRQRRELEAQAAGQNKSLEDFLNEVFAGEARSLLKPSGPYDSFEDVFRAGKEKETEAQLREKFGRKIDSLLKH